MTARVPWTVEPGGLAGLHDQIFELAERGISYRRVARKLKKHPSTVQWFFFKHGLKGARPMNPHRRPYYRNGTLVRPFSAREDELIETLRAGGAALAAIGRAIEAAFGYKRTSHAIQVRLTMLAARGAE